MKTNTAKKLMRPIMIARNKISQKKKAEEIKNQSE
jgi:hypothetical protein